MSLKNVQFFIFGFAFFWLLSLMPIGEIKVIYEDIAGPKTEESK